MTRETHLEFRNHAKNRLAGRGREARRRLGRGTQKAIVKQGKLGGNEDAGSWRWRGGDRTDIPEKIRDSLRPARKRPMVGLSLLLQTGADLEAERARIAATESLGDRHAQRVVPGEVEYHPPPGE